MICLENVSCTAQHAGLMLCDMLHLPNVELILFSEDPLRLFQTA